jgi:hypothetical protein
MIKYLKRIGCSVNENANEIVCRNRASKRHFNFKAND